MLILWSLLACLIVLFASFAIWSARAYANRSERGRSEYSAWQGGLARFFIPSFGRREHFTERGWGMRNRALIAWLLLIPVGIAFVVQLSRVAE